MATGTPVLASRAGAIPEILGGAAVLVDPYEVASIATGLERIVSDGDLRKQLSLWGLGQARRYTWERAAEQTWKVYEKVLAEK